MPARAQSLKRIANIETTPEDKGLTLTLKLTAYDNGQLYLNGRPLTAGRFTHAGIIAAELIAQLEDQAEKRRAEKAGKAQSGGL